MQSGAQVKFIDCIAQDLLLWFRFMTFQFRSHFSALKRGQKSRSNSPSAATTATTEPPPLVQPLAVLLDMSVSVALVVEALVTIRTRVGFHVEVFGHRVQ